MNKKRILSALVLGSLTYGAWLAYDLRNNAKSAQKNAPLAAPANLTQDFEKQELQPTQVLNKPLPVKSRRAQARKSVKTSPVSSESTEIAAAKVEPEPKAEVPMPRAWSGQFEKRNRGFVKEECDLDRPCSPRGRDGVLLVGAALALNSWQPQFDKILSIGSYRERTPLLVYK